MRNANVKTPEKFILDTSAILTWFEAEAGMERVKQIIQEEQVYLPWIVLLEVNYITQQERGEIVSQNRYATLKKLFTNIIWEMDEPTLLTAARWKARYRVSFADAIIAAYAFRQEATLLHKDPEFEALPPQVLRESLPYKKAP